MKVKKWLAMLLAVVMVLSLAACGEKESETTKSAHTGTKACMGAWALVASIRGRRRVYVSPGARNFSG